MLLFSFIIHRLLSASINQISQRNGRDDEGNETRYVYVRALFPRFDEIVQDVNV